MTSGPSDGELVRRHRAGDAAAFDRIVERHRKVVYLSLRRLLGSHEEADEAAQEAFVRAWRALAGYRGEAALRTWLVRIALNVAKTMRSRRRPDGELLDPGSLEDGSERSDETIRRRQLGEHVRRAVCELPPRQREVVMLKVFSEMTYREVADTLELSEGTVKAHLHQAVSNLRRLMKGTSR